MTDPHEPALPASSGTHDTGQARPGDAAPWITVTLERGGERWIVRSRACDEPTVRKTLASWVGRADCDFGPRDAALMLERFRDRLGPGLFKPGSPG